MISSALRGVVSQRLVRKICPQCRKAYTPTEEEKRMVGIAENEDVTFYKGEGCQECGRTGYRGRRGVFEILTLDAALRREVANNASSEELTKTALENGFVTMKDNCRRLVLEGVTTVSEAAKAINSAAG